MPDFATVKLCIAEKNEAASSKLKIAPTEALNPTKRERIRARAH